MDPGNACAYCGEDVDRHGTTLETTLLIEDRSYSIEPSFCSWQHAAAWFNQAPPDISEWTTLRPRRAPADGGPGTWLILLALVVLLLAVAITLGVTLS